MRFRSWTKKNGNTNVKLLNRVLGHHMRPVWPVCTMAESLPASGILLVGFSTILPQESQSTHTCFTEVENAISGYVPEYPINARLGSDLVTEKAMTWVTSVSCSSNCGATTCGWGHWVVSSFSHANHNYRQPDLCSIFIHDPKHAGLLFA